MAHKNPDPFPPYFAVAYFNQKWVQEELGAPTNFTAVSITSQNALLYTAGDTVRVEGLKYLEYLLNTGVKVALLYGDRDYRW